MKPTVDEFIEYVETIRCISLTQAQKLLIKKFYKNYESDSKLYITYPPKMGYTLIMKALKGETNEKRSSKSYM